MVAHLMNVKITIILQYHHLKEVTLSDLQNYLWSSVYSLFERLIEIDKYQLVLPAEEFGTKID